MQENKKKEEKEKKELEAQRKKTREEREQSQDHSLKQRLNRSSAPIQSQTDTEAFLAEIRREVLRVLMTVLPGSLTPLPTLGQASAAGSSTAGLNWAAALQLNSQ